MQIHAAIRAAAGVGPIRGESFMASRPKDCRRPAASLAGGTSARGDEGSISTFLLLGEVPLFGHSIGRLAVVQDKGDWPAFPH